MGDDHQLVVAGRGVRARARWGDTVLAETSGALRVEETGQPPALYFPRGDVRVELLVDEGHTATCPVKGTAALWSFEAGGRPSDDGGPGDWGMPSPSTDGADVLWSFTEPTSAAGALVGYAAFDHDRVVVELLDAVGSDDERDLTIKRFPNWGDAAHLIDILDVRPGGPDAAGETHFESVARSDLRRPVVEGSQMLGQAIVAASRSAGGRRVVSAHLMMTRAADAFRGLDIDLDPVTSGRTFTATFVKVSQGERVCAAGDLLLDVTAEDVVRHELTMSEIPGPYDCPPFDMGVTGRDLRIADGAYTGDPDAPVGPPVLDAWVRFRDVPDEQAIHAGLLAQFTGHLPIAAALRPHEGVGQAQAHRTLSTAINAIAISFHADVRADQWMLYHHVSTFAGDGMTHAECRVYDIDRRLLASFSVDAMVRAFAPSSGAQDDRKAL